MDVSDPLDALAALYRLKSVHRAGWTRHGVAHPESVAAHSWGVSSLVLVLLPDELDLGRALAYAALHDAAEAQTGDITPYDGISKAEKAGREHAAMRAMTGTTHPKLLSLWEAYERQADPEARFVKQLDRVDMGLQAWCYHREGHPHMREFLDSARDFVTEPHLVAVLDDIHRRW